MSSRQAPVPHPVASVARDSRAWQLQVWASFALAVSLCSIGLAWLPGQDLDRAFMVMGYVFCLTAVLVLSKSVRDQQATAAESPMWRLVVWGGFTVAMGLTGWGLLRMNISETYKAYLGVSWLYLVSSAFTLAKTLRDAHEASLAQARADARAQLRREMQQGLAPDAQ